MLNDIQIVIILTVEYFLNYAVCFIVFLLIFVVEYLPPGTSFFYQIIRTVCCEYNIRVLVLILVLNVSAACEIILVVLWVTDLAQLACLRRSSFESHLQVSPFQLATRYSSLIVQV